MAAGVVQEDAQGLEEQGSGMYHLQVQRDRKHSAGDVISEGG